MIFARTLFLVSDHVVDCADGLQIFVVLAAVIAFPLFRADSEFNQDHLGDLIIVHVGGTFGAVKMIADNLFD